MQSVSLPPLIAGERLDQPTFHARYAAMPESVWAELIEGVVHILPPVKASHGRVNAHVIYWLGRYHMAAPDTDALAHATTILGRDDEVQPDACLCVPPDHGGQTQVDVDGYMNGAPEFIAEVALDGGAVDLYGKRRAYERAGVREYVVLVLSESRVVWLVRRGQGFTPLGSGPDGILRSEFFGGLWMDPAAMLRQGTLRVEEVLQQGLVSPEHKAFLEKLRRP